MNSGEAHPRVQGAERVCALRIIFIISLVDPQQQPKFTIWDKVTVYEHHARRRTGPYYVYERRNGFRYILRNIEDGTLINEGAKFNEDDLN